MKTQPKNLYAPELNQAEAAAASIIGTFTKALAEVEKFAELPGRFDDQVLYNESDALPMRVTDTRIGICGERIYTVRSKQLARTFARDLTLKFNQGDKLSSPMKIISSSVVEWAPKRMAAIKEMIATIEKQIETLKASS